VYILRITFNPDSRVYIFSFLYLYSVMKHPLHYSACKTHKILRCHQYWIRRTTLPITFSQPPRENSGGSDNSAWITGETCYFLLPFTNGFLAWPTALNQLSFTHILKIGSSNSHYIASVSAFWLDKIELLTIFISRPVKYSAGELRPRSFLS